MRDARQWHLFGAVAGYTTVLTANYRNGGLKNASYVSILQLICWSAVGRSKRLFGQLPCLMQFGCARVVFALDLRDLLLKSQLGFTACL